MYTHICQTCSISFYCSNRCYKELGFTQREVWLLPSTFEMQSMSYLIGMPLFKAVTGHSRWVTLLTPNSFRVGTGYAKKTKVWFRVGVGHSREANHVLGCEIWVTWHLQPSIWFQTQGQSINQSKLCNGAPNKNSEHWV